MAASITDPEQFGVSFSLKQCRNFGIDPKKCLEWLITDAGFRRFRLMSYWNEHEKRPGEYNFDELDRQIKRITETGGVVTLCLGARQPRWPENHWPKWAWKLSKDERSAALLTFIEQVVERYKHEACIVSYQLENEALLTNFGERSEVDRKRLREEFNLVKRLDPTRPIIMTVSDQWGLPLRGPIPDVVGFSYYHIMYSGKSQRYRLAHHYGWLHRLRRRLIWLLKHRPVFIHELQLEPWGSDAIWKMKVAEQDRSMSPGMIARSVRLARKTNLRPIDLWGGEWWYWRLTKHKDPAIWQAVKDAIQE